MLIHSVSFLFLHVLNTEDVAVEEMKKSWTE